MNFNEFKGATIEDAIALGLSELNLTEETAEIQILSKGGFMSRAVVKITPKAIVETEIDEEEISFSKSKGSVEISKSLVEKSNAFIKGLIDCLNLDLEIETICNSDGILHTLNGPSSSAIIGYRGEVLDAIQYLALLATNKDEKDFVRVSIDAGSYRQKRKETLATLANRLAQKAIENSRRVKIEPMNPYERRIIHFALQDNPFVTTISEGEGKFRHVVIVPKEERFSANYGKTNFDRNGLGKTRKFGYDNKRR